ncbi:MAG: YvcK family protein [Candidatus Liptonbacteria bacterium]|nr:YvcK family protein [Candidatus Liptonbacteria bacterium]
MATSKRGREKKLRIVVLGGGTGTFTVLSGLKKYPLDLSAVVSMADDGGSTGMLRDELGVLPPGDIRQCLVALSTSDRTMRALMNYRFSSGRLKGHSFGNLLLSALEKITGSFDKAVEKASEILRLRGKVIPATLDRVRLVARLKDGRVIRGQSMIHDHNLHHLKKITLDPKGKANPKAMTALRTAHAIVIGPGGFYSSLVPTFLISGIPQAIRKSRAKKIYICNLMNKAGHTDGFTVKKFTEKIEEYVGGTIDYVIYNNKRPSASLITRYAREGERLVEPGPHLPRTRFVGADLISKKFPKPQKGDVLTRNLIRHNQDTLAKLILAVAQ